MLKISEKAKFIKIYQEIALNEVCMEEIFGKDDETKVDEILDDLSMVLCAADTYRYIIPFEINSVPKCNFILSEVLPNLDEYRFKQLIRVSWKIFKRVLGLIKNDDAFNEKQFPVETQLAIALYRLVLSGEGATLAKIATLFGIGDGGTIQLITNRVFRAILKLKDKYIYWPSSSERKSLVAETTHELPYCVGYVDGTEIKLAEKPMQDPEAFFSRKHICSIKAQGVCDYKLRIRHLVLGYPGSVHDARIFNNSNLALQPENFFSGEEWIAGDSAYKLTTTVLTPFRNAGPDVASQRRKDFNKTFSQYRVRIEHCFMFLKERFNSLKELKIAIKDDSSTKKACLWIMVCAILHNIILEEESADEWTKDDSGCNEQSSDIADQSSSTT